MFDEFFCEEASEIVENVGEFMDGSPMRPSGPIIRKGRLPPKRKYIVNQDSTKNRPQSPQSRICSPYSNVCAQCIIDEFAQQTLNSSKLIRRRVSRPVCKRAVVNNINTSESHNSSTRSSFFSSSQRQRLSTSKRLSCSQRKKSLKKTLPSCEKLSVHSSVESHENLSAINGTHKGHTNLSSEVSEKTNRPSLNMLYSVYNSTSRKESIRQESKNSVYAFNMTKRESFHDSTEKREKLNASSTISSDKLGLCKTEKNKQNNETTKKLHKTNEEGHVDDTVKQLGYLYGINQHVSSSIYKRHSLPRVLDNNEIDKISKSLFRKDNYMNNTTHKKSACNADDNDSKSNRMREEKHEEEQNDLMYDYYPNIDEEHAIQENAFDKECKIQSPLAFHEDPSSSKAREYSLDSQFTDNKVVSCKAVSANKNALTSSATAQHSVYGNTSKIVNIMQVNNVGNEYQIHASDNVENTGNSVQSSNLATELAAEREHEQPHENIEEMHHFEGDERPHAYQLTQKMTRLSDMITNVSTNSIFNLAIDEESIDSIKNRNCTQKLEEDFSISHRTNSKRDGINEVDGNKKLKDNLSNVKKCEELNNTKSKKVNVIKEIPRTNTPTSSSLPRWQDAFSSLSSPVADCLSTTAADLPSTKETNKTKAVVKEPHKQKKSLEKEYCLPANNALTPTPESIDSDQIHLQNNNKTVQRVEKRKTNVLENIYEQEQEKRKAENKVNTHININSNSNDNDNHNDKSIGVKSQVPSLVTHIKMRNASMAHSMRSRNGKAPSTLPLAADLHKCSCIDTGTDINNSHNNTITQSKLIPAQKNASKRPSILVSKIEIGLENNKDEKVERTIIDRDREMLKETTKTHTSLTDTHKKSLPEEQKLLTLQQEHINNEHDGELPRQRLHSTTHIAHAPTLTKPLVPQNKKEQPITRYSRLVAETHSVADSPSVQACSINSGTKCEKLPEIVPAGRRKSSHKVTRGPSFV